MTQNPQDPSGQYGAQPFPQQPGGDPGYGRPAKQKPSSVALAVNLLWANIVLSAITTVIGFVLIDDVVDKALEGSDLDRDAVRAGAVITLIVGFLIGVGITALFAYFIGKGANWARIVYTVITALSLIFGVFGIAGQPGLVVVVQIIGYLLSIAILVLLYRRESNEYFAR